MWSALQETARPSMAESASCSAIMVIALSERMLVARDARNSRARMQQLHNLNEETYAFARVQVKKVDWRQSPLPEQSKNYSQIKT